MRYASILLTFAAAGFAQEKPLAPLTSQELPVIWQERFIQIDDVGSQQALVDIRRMIQAPQLVLPFLEAKLKPVPTADAAKIAGLIADLDSSSFDTREKAMKELDAIGVAAGPALEKMLKEPTALEVRQRLETLLRRIDSRGLTADDHRGLRGIEVLEGIGTAEAKAQLAALAKGGAGHVVTERAQRALANLAGRQ